MVDVISLVIYIFIFSPKLNFKKSFQLSQRKWLPEAFDFFFWATEWLYSGHLQPRDYYNETLIDFESRVQKTSLTDSGSSTHALFPWSIAF